MKGREFKNGREVLAGYRALRRLAEKRIAEAERLLLWTCGLKRNMRPGTSL